MPSEPGQDNAIARFYSANPITIWVGSGDDGGYGVYARALARHMPRHIPGRPEMRVAFMGEKAGFVLSNKLITEMQRDGTVIGGIRSANMVEAVFNNSPDRKFDARELGMIGTISRQGGTVVTWHTSPTKTIEDARQRDVPTGAESPFSNVGTLPAILNALLGTRFRVRHNLDRQALERALESGEVEAVCGLGYNTLLAAHPHWIDGNKLNYLAHTGLDPDPLLPGVPCTLDFARNEDDRNVIRLMDTRQVMGRPYTTTPGVPPERLATLQSAFQATMKDPEFLAEAKQRRMIVDPIDHVRMAQILASAHAMPNAIVKRTWALINGKPAWRHDLAGRVHRGPKPLPTERTAMDKLIIYVATGYPGSATPKKPAIPKTWDQFYQGARDCEAAGASIIHFHGPHDDKGRIVPDEWGKVCEGIRKHSNLLVDFGQAGAPIEERRELMKMGSANPDFMGISLTNHDYRRHSDAKGYFDVYYDHQRPELIEYAQLCIEQKIKPNWELWHLGGLWNFNFLKDQGLIEKPYWFCCLFGTPGGVWSPSSMAEVSHRLDHIPEGSHALIAPRGPAGPINQTRLLTLGIMRGAHVRLGCQDLADFIDGVPATSNAQIVSRIARISRELGREIATPEEARQILGMAKRK